MSMFDRWILKGFIRRFRLWMIKRIVRKFDETIFWSETGFTDSVLINDNEDIIEALEDTRNETFGFVNGSTF